MFTKKSKLSETAIKGYNGYYGNECIWNSMYFHVSFIQLVGFFLLKLF